VVVVEYSRERGIELSVSDDPSVRLLMKRCDPLVCARGPDAAAEASVIAGVTASDAGLSDYWREFTGDDEPGGGAPRRAALEWLLAVLSVNRGADWCVVLEG
jgi:hypothetical protein